MSEAMLSREEFVYRLCMLCSVAHEHHDRPHMDALKAHDQALRNEVARLQGVLEPAQKAIKAIDKNPNDMRLRRDAEVACFYAVQIALTPQAGKGGGA